VAAALATRRDEILDRWLAAAADQPFHCGRRERAVAGHIPRLFDALVALLQCAAPRWVDPASPLDDPAVLQAAQDHARARFEQGLAAADIVTEFRLLRQEIGRALHLHLADEVPTRDVVGAELLVHDALDGAVALGLTALTERVDEVREEFLATTLHDVRQPLTTIKAAIQLALRGLARPAPKLEQIMDALHRAEAATDRMLALLTTLADASRLALGRQQVHPVPSDLVELLLAAIGRLGPEGAGRVRLDVPPGINATGCWDPALLERVIDNLLSNAVKYSPPDTPIAVTVRADADTVHLAVQDQGIGLAADELAALFRRYGRTRRAVEHGIQGLGLGLYLARGMIEASGGRIWAESPGPGAGTTLHVVLPRQGPTPADTE
jgi:signal transduction histidine kinase